MLRKECRYTNLHSLGRNVRRLEDIDNGIDDDVVVDTGELNNALVNPPIDHRDVYTLQIDLGVKNRREFPFSGHLLKELFVRLRPTAVLF